MEEHTQKIKETAAILAEKATRGLAVLAAATLDDAKSATAIPDAVTSVFAPSTYMFRESELVQAQPRVCASYQIKQTKICGRAKSTATNT